MRADDLARSALTPGRSSYDAVVKRFGASIVHADGTINRRALGRIVFSDEGARRDLEHIIHPEVRRLMLAWLSTVTAPIALYEIPLWFEAGAPHPEAQKVIAVICGRETSIKRVMARDGLSRREVEQRLDAQLSADEKARRSDIVVCNEGSLDDLYHQVEAIWETLLR